MVTEAVRQLVGGGKAHHHAIGPAVVLGGYAAGDFVLGRPIPVPVDVVLSALIIPATPLLPEGPPGTE
jgi:hypothetical protein